jgi:hypothetical protein
MQLAAIECSVASQNFVRELPQMEDSHVSYQAMFLITFCFHELPSATEFQMLTMQIRYFRSKGLAFLFKHKAVLDASPSQRTGETRITLTCFAEPAKVAVFIPSKRHYDDGIEHRQGGIELRRRVTPVNSS